MVELQSQRLCAELVDDVIELKATHPTALRKAGPEIQKFLSDI